MTKTKAALLWLAGIKDALVPESYQQLAAALEDIVNEHEHEVEELGKAHVVAALHRFSNHHKIAAHGGN